MSNEATETKPKSRRTLVITLAVVLGVVAGGGAGAFFAGPLLASRLHPTAAAAAPAKEEAESAEAKADEHAEGGESGEGSTAQPMYMMENLVLNPAHTNGTRFLMTTVAFGTKSDDAVKEMEARDAEVRDMVLRVLGTKTVMDLADVTHRDSLKTELRDSVGVLFAPGTVRDVYFPQFVIQ